MYTYGQNSSEIREFVIPLALMESPYRAYSTANTKRSSKILITNISTHENYLNISIIYQSNCQQWGKTSKT